MRVVVLHPSYAGSDSIFREHDPECDPTPFLAGHDVEHLAVTKAAAVHEVSQRVRRGTADVFFNLCDGAWDEDRAGIEVVETLERLGAAFTGAGTGFYENDRMAIKLACHYAGVDTPRGAIVHGADEAAALDGLAYPRIVKHPSSYGSIGLTAASRVADAASLAREVERMVAAHGAALVEEFIEGREFILLVAEGADDPRRPRVLMPLEYRFPPGETFQHFDLKWVDHVRAGWGPVADAALDRRLRDTAARVFAGLDGSGYASLDLRGDAAGRLFLLDVNPNCGVFYPEGYEGGADTILEQDPIGQTGFVEHVIACACRRRERGRSSLAAPADLHGAPRAARDIAAGEVIVSFEQRHLRLVSLDHVERTFDERRKRWFRGHSHPLSDGVYVLWQGAWEGDRLPGGWPVLPHACEPNARVRGLEIRARRDIPRGEAVSVDHATFRAGEMEEFACACGAAECRRVIRASDHLLAGLEERYDGFVSDHVRQRRRSAGSEATKA